MFQSQTSWSDVIWKVGRFVVSYRPSPRIQRLMGVIAPAPAATMRSGSVGEAPVVVTRTGRIELTPCPGTSFRARKSKLSET